MAIRSRKTRTRRVTVESALDASEKLDVSIRALTATENDWLVERMGALDMETLKFEVVNVLGFRRDTAMLGLIELHDPPIDPDTGMAFELRRHKMNIKGEVVEVLTPGTLEALHDYLTSLNETIQEFSKLTDEERDAARPTGKLVVADGSPSAEAATEEKPTAPTTA